MRRSHRCLGPDWCDLQLQRRARVIRHLHRVLAAAIFIDHVIGHRTILVIILRRAALHVLHLRRLRTLNVVANRRAADDANHSRNCGTCPATDGIAHGATGYGPHQGAGTRFTLWRRHLLDRTNLARNGLLLHDGC